MSSFLRMCLGSALAALLLVPCGVASAADHVVLLRTVKLLPEPRPAASDGREYVSGQVFLRRRVSDHHVLIADTGGQQGWVKASSVAPVSAFRRVRAWRGQARLEVGDGDYDALYRFLRNGSFTVSEAVFDPKLDTYKRITRSGQLYTHGKLIWARILGEPPYSSRMLVETRAGLLWGARQELQ